MKTLNVLAIVTLCFCVNQLTLAGPGKPPNAPAKINVREIHDDAVNLGPKTKRGALGRLALARLRLAGDVADDIITPHLAFAMIGTLVAHFRGDTEVGAQARELLYDMRAQGWIDNDDLAFHNLPPRAQPQAAAVLAEEIPNEEESGSEPEAKKARSAGAEAEDDVMGAGAHHDLTEPVAFEHDFLAFNEPLFGLAENDIPNADRAFAWTDEDCLPLVPEPFEFNEEPLPALEDNPFDSPVRAPPAPPTFNVMAHELLEAADAAIRQAAITILPVVAAAAPVVIEVAKSTSKKRRTGRR